MSYLIASTTVDNWLERVEDLDLGVSFSPALLSRIKSRLRSDLHSLAREAAFIFSQKRDYEEQTRLNIDLFRDWALSQEPPSLVALCIFSLESMGVKLPGSLEKGVLVAGLLGEVESGLAYHNNMHYRKVVFHMIRLIHEHNEIYKGTAKAFSARQIALLLMAACVHDLGHDGLGNTIKGVFYPGRLERQSAELAAKFLKMADVTDEDINALTVMILCTDVVPLGDPSNPCNQMKMLYRAHYIDQRPAIGRMNLDEQLQPLESDPSLALMSLILHEADVATSAGMDYRVTQYETAILCREGGQENPGPRHVLDFLNLICKRQMMSSAGQQLYGANMARIIALAEDDSNRGVEVYPLPESSGFILGTSSTQSKTIN